MEVLIDIAEIVGISIFAGVAGAAVIIGLMRAGYLP